MSSKLTRDITRVESSGLQTPHYEFQIGFSRSVPLLMGVDIIFGLSETAMCEIRV